MPVLFRGVVYKEKGGCRSSGANLRLGWRLVHTLSLHTQGVILGMSIAQVFFPAVLVHGIVRISFLQGCLRWSMLQSLRYSEPTKPDSSLNQIFIQRWAGVGWGPEPVQVDGMSLSWEQGGGISSSTVQSSYGTSSCFGNGTTASRVNGGLLSCSCSDLVCNTAGKK